MTVTKPPAPLADRARIDDRPLPVGTTRLAGILICPACGSDSLYAFGYFREDTPLRGRLLVCTNTSCRAAVKAGEVIDDTAATGGTRGR